MADGFRRSPLFRLPRWAPPKPGHRNPVRSSCFSWHFHRIIRDLDDKIRGRRERHAKPPPLCGSPEWIAAGLERLDVLLAALTDLLLLHQAQEPLRSSDFSPLIKRLADDFLRLADSHGSFRGALTEIKNYQTVAQIALRQNDEPGLASAVQSQRQVEEEFIRLAAGICNVTRSPAMAEEEDSWEAEMAGIMCETRPGPRSIWAEVGKPCRLQLKKQKQKKKRDQGPEQGNPKTPARSLITGGVWVVAGRCRPLGRCETAGMPLGGRCTGKRPSYPRSIQNKTPPCRVFAIPSSPQTELDPLPGLLLHHLR